MIGEDSMQPIDFRIDPRKTYMTRGQGLTVKIEEMEYPYNEDYVRVTYLNGIRSMVFIKTGKASSQGMESYDLLFAPVIESEIEEKTILFITPGQLLGKLADYAIQQSPYLFPENLESALTTFADNLTRVFKMHPFHQGFYEVFYDRKYFVDSLYAAMDVTPQILAWNDRKNGRDGHGFSSRFDGHRNPDDDFIDLDALMGNVVRELYNEHGSTKSNWHKTSEDDNE